MSKKLKTCRTCKHYRSVLWKVGRTTFRRRECEIDHTETDLNFTCGKYEEWDSLYITIKT